MRHSCHDPGFSPKLAVGPCLKRVNQCRMGQGYGLSGSAQSRAAVISSASGRACCSAGGKVSYV
jgi:hypothetical protein